MARYEVSITKSVQKFLDKLPDRTADKLESAMKNLENDPRPPGATKLTGQEAYRIRVGSYRIIYEIHDKILLVKVIDAGHRRDVYNKK